MKKFFKQNIFIIIPLFIVLIFVVACAFIKIDYEITSPGHINKVQNVINVEKIIGEFKNKFHMKNRAFGGGQGTLLISLATPKDYQIKYVVGDDVPLVFSISTTFIRNAVGSGDKHWLLNGMEIPFINESVSVQKEGRTNTIHGESYTKTLLTRQTRYYKFNFDANKFKVKSDGFICK